MNYWKCPKCHGTGKVILAYSATEMCFDCDGTGNGYVDGAARYHAREVDRIERKQREVNLDHDPR